MKSRFYFRCFSGRRRNLLRRYCRGRRSELRCLPPTWHGITGTSYTIFKVCIQNRDIQKDKRSGAENKPNHQHLRKHSLFIRTQTPFSLVELICLFSQIVLHPDSFLIK